MPRGATPPRLAAAALMLVIAGVHFQQYVAFMSEVPTIGVLFLLNAAAGAGLAIALVSREALLRLAAALGAAGLAVGSLVSIFLALYASVFGYSEPRLRAPILVAIVSELLVLPFLAAIAVGAARELRRRG
ncbi:MAG: hypothetical protein ACYCU0_15190 [Solirubrobacteraceae bacterium]